MEKEAEGRLVEVYPQRLSALLKEIGREDLLTKTLQIIKNRHFGVEERNWLIRLLVSRGITPNQKVGDCFGLDRRKISQIAKGLGHSRRKQT